VRFQNHPLPKPIFATASGANGIPGLRSAYVKQALIARQRLEYSEPDRASICQAAARAYEALWRTVGQMGSFQAGECLNFFRHSGYVSV